MFAISKQPVRRLFKTNKREPTITKTQKKRMVYKLEYPQSKTKEQDISVQTYTACCPIEPPAFQKQISQDR